MEILKLELKREGRDSMKQEGREKEEGTAQQQ